MTPNWIKLEGTANTRDLGGIPTPTGEIAGSVVLRSDNLQDLTQADVATLLAVPVTLVIDLRTQGEVEAEGPTALDAAGIRHEVLSFVPDPNAAERGEGRVLPDRRGMDPAETYVNYLKEMPASAVEAVRLVARNTGAAIINCAAGKDRTGTLAAILLDAAGANRDAVVADYVATAQVVDAVVARLAARPIYAPELVGSDPARHVPQARTIEALLGYLDEGWGGSAGWLSANGLDEDDLMALRQRLTPGQP